MITMKALTPEEIQKLNETKAASKDQTGDQTIEWRNGWPQSSHPLPNTYIQIARNRLEQEGEVVGDFRVRQNFNEAMNRLKGALPKCRDQNKRVLDKFINSGCLDSLLPDTVAYGQKMQIIDDIADLCKEEPIRKNLWDAVYWMKDNISKHVETYQDTDQMIRTMFNVGSLESGKVSQQDVDLCKKYIPNLPLTTSIQTGNQAQQKDGFTM